MFVEVSLPEKRIEKEINMCIAMHLPIRPKQFRIFAETRTRDTACRADVIAAAEVAEAIAGRSRFYTRLGLANTRS